MICEKCGKIVGNYIESKDKIKTEQYYEETIICKNCKAIFCKKCFENLLKCSCCGKQLKNEE